MEQTMKAKTTKKYQLTLLDMCLPDYFAGYHKPVMQVPIDSSMTKGELTDAIISEYDEVGYDLLEWPELTEEQLGQLCDEFILTDLPFEHEDIESPACEYSDSVCLFIILTEND